MDPRIVACPDCLRRNRVPVERQAENGRCGACKAQLFPGRPLDLGASSFDAHLVADIPVLVDCWAAWCGPCKAFAPTFAKFAAEIGARVRCAKIDTEAEPGLAARLGIRSIPTLILFVGGRERARISGALPPAQLRQWVSTNLDR